MRIEKAHDQQGRWYGLNFYTADEFLDSNRTVVALYFDEIDEADGSLHPPFFALELGHDSQGTSELALTLPQDALKELHTLLGEWIEKGGSSWQQ